MVVDRGKVFSGRVLEIGVVMWTGTQILYLETGKQAQLCGDQAVWDRGGDFRAGHVDTPIHMKYQFLRLSRRIT